MIKLTTYIISSGFTEQVRYIYYKCLINFGFPFPKRFLGFYQYFNKYCVSEKLKSPGKMHTQFYSEIILRMITLQKITPSKNKYISDFFFNGENVDIVINNLNLIITFTQMNHPLKITNQKKTQRLHRYQVIII